MIAIDIQCVNDHIFEGWFEDNRAYEGQKKKGLIQCPFCGVTAVSRIPSTFAIKSSSASRNISPEQAKLMEAGKKIVDYIEKNFDDVGSEFTKEALKIHYGVSEPRNIRGISNEEDEKILEKEGVDFFKFPMPVRPDTDS